MVLTVEKNDTAMISGEMVILPLEEYNELKQAQENLQFIKKMEHSMEQSRTGRVVVKTMDELEKMVNG